MKSIAVVIPACNEEQHIEACLHSLELASAQFQQYKIDQKQYDLDEFSIKTIVVLDHCHDATASIVEAHDVEMFKVDYQCVGQTRHHGIQRAIELGCDWICCTDADSQVSANWFEAMLNHQPTDVICGVVQVDAWDHLSVDTKCKYLEHYQDCMGHRHIHGANLCFKSNIYQDIGGFNFLTCHEDVDLVNRMKKHGCHITWSNQLRVTTSSRLQSRVTQGFSHFLTSLEAEVEIKSP